MKGTPPLTDTEPLREYINIPNLFKKDSIQEFAQGDVLLRIGSRAYSAQVIVAMRSSGKLILYDILNLQRTEIQEKTGRSNTKNPQKSETGRRATSSEHSIPQNTEDDQTEFSLKGTENARELAALRGENDLLRMRIGTGRTACMGSYPSCGRSFSTNNERATPPSSSCTSLMF